MSIKDLFGKKSGKILPLTDPETIGQEVESVKLVESARIEKDRFIPDIDFSEPENFAKFGSAEKYYADSIKLIYKSFPYDGSRNEKTEWFNSSSLLTNYTFNNLYPRNTGFIKFGFDYGTITSTSNGYSITDKPEYILIKGGPNTYSQTDTAKNLFGKSNYYNEDFKRASNLSLNGEDGVTVEFYIKKEDLSGSAKQVIFDLWNSASFTSSDYARFTIETHPGNIGEENNFYVTFVSGTNGANDVLLAANNITDSNWHHIAITAKNDNSTIAFQLFQDGELLSQELSGTTVSQVQGPMMATIGSLVHDTGSAGLGYGKLSASLDEFRYWKSKRTDKDIFRFYFTEVYGGTNTDDANTDLGVYYKFNEGIFNNQQFSAYDANVIDYSGRISNGTWFGYSVGSRETGSALIESGFTQEEPADPILYPNHPEVLILIQTLQQKTISYDQMNNSSIYNSFASWILEEDQEKGEGLLEITQIISEYLDEMFYHIQSLPTLKDEDFRKQNPLPFSKRLVESRGLSTVELFSDSTILETVLSRNEQDVYDEKIYHIKNSIYQNIYNNILYIYRSKGTEKSIRNLLRCFGIDTELIKINLYADDQSFTFEDRYEYTSQKRKFVDFNNPDRFEGTVYQVTQSGEPNSLAYIVGDIDSKYFGNTIEIETIFPRKYDINEDQYFETNFLSSSVFGMHQPQSTVDYNTWATNDSASIQIFGVRPERESKDSYFLLSSSCFGVQLTSSLFKDVYTDQKWLFAIRIKNEKYPFDGVVIGADNGDYILEFSGFNTELDILKESFIVSASIDKTIAEAYFTANKRLYVGSHHQNFTGSVIVGSDNKQQLSDLQIGTVRYWLNYIPEEVLISHALDITDAGPESFVQNVENALITQLKDQTIPQSETLVLHWRFDSIEVSDNGAGTPTLGLNDAGFDVIDLSSGSIDQLSRYEIVSDISRRLYPGRGDFFLRNNDKVVAYEYVANAKRRQPEILNNDDLISILQQDDITYVRDMVPVNHFLSIEKSMYQNISEEMLRWIGTIKQFNNLLGKPADRYEMEYRDLSFLRRMFFEKVDNTPDFEKFVEFYKWIDWSVGKIIQEIIPASMGTTTIASNIVESHILERNKYRHKLPTLEFRKKDPIAAIRTINELKYNWKFGHAPIPLEEDTNCLWWKERDIDNRQDREQIFNVLKSTYDRKFTTVYDLNTDAIVIINKNPKEQEVVKQITKFGSGEYLEIDIPSIVDKKDCNDK
jgi:hypothetical protein